jgi:hypothetical protein
VKHLFIICQEEEGRERERERVKVSEGASTGRVGGGAEEDEARGEE